MKTSGRYVHRKGEFPLVYWITGGSCSGKSSIADKLAQIHDMQVLHTDSITYSLWERADPQRHPTAFQLRPTLLQGFLHWMQLPVDQLAEASYELFDLLLHHVETFGSGPVVVEGMSVNLAAATEVSSLARIVCLTGTDRFLHSREREHPFVLQYYSTWDNPEQTLAALTEGHIRLTRAYRTRAPEYGIRLIVTDETTPFADNLRQVEEHFGLR